MPVAIYIDFETTTPTDNCFNPKKKKKKKFVMSYVLIVAFHPHLNLRNITVQRINNH